MRCDQCKHWKSQDAETYDDDWRAARAGFGRCTAIRMLERIETEATEGMSWPGGPKVDWDSDGAALAYTNAEDAAVRSELVYAQDGSGYRADVYSAPEFFCARYAQGIEAAEADKTTKIGLAVGESPVRRMRPNPSSQESR